MNTRIMPVALVVVSLVGTHAAQADTAATLIRVVPLAELPLDSSWVAHATIIVIDDSVPPLRDLIHWGCDDDTGEHLYLAEIEW